MGCPPICTKHARSSPEDGVRDLQRTPVLFPNLISRPDIGSADLGLHSAVSQALQGLQHAMENTQGPQLEPPKQALQESPHAMENTQSPQLEPPKQAPTPGKSHAAHGDVASEPFPISPVLIGKQCWQDMLLHEVWLSEHDVHDDGLLILPHCSHISDLQSTASQMRNFDMNVPAFNKHIAHTVASERHQRSEISYQGGARLAPA